MGFSSKQLEILRFPTTDYTALICDGAVRSGKTSVMALSFILWLMQSFNHRNFAICGKSVQSAARNVIIPLTQVDYFRENGYSLRYSVSNHLLTITRGNRENYVYVFGGKDESSYSLIQGITLAGVFLDEVALMPRSFVEQALARCSVEGSRFWFNCNPENPSHWFYEEWIKRAEDKNALHLHFLMEDNPSLSKAVLDRYRSIYSGVFYDRYVRGLWVAAEGLVYPMFDRETHLTDKHEEDGVWYLSIDYGTVNPTAMGLWRIYGGSATMEREYYHNSRAERAQKTDEEYYRDLEKFVGDVPIQRIILDPSAASFRECIRRHGKYKVMDADNSVLDGIRFAGTMLSQGKVKIHESCVNTIKEFGAYLWDEKASADKVIKENDHSMDQMRYLLQTLRHRYFKERRPYKPIMM